MSSTTTKIVLGTLGALGLAGIAVALWPGKAAASLAPGAQPPVKDLGPGAPPPVLVEVGKSGIQEVVRVKAGQPIDLTPGFAVPPDDASSGYRWSLSFESTAGAPDISIAGPINWRVIFNKPGAGVLRLMAYRYELVKGEPSGLVPNAPVAGPYAVPFEVV